MMRTAGRRLALNHHALNLARSRVDHGTITGRSWDYFGTLRTHYSPVMLALFSMKPHPVVLRIFSRVIAHPCALDRTTIPTRAVILRQHTTPFRPMIVPFDDLELVYQSLRTLEPPHAHKFPRVNAQDCKNQRPPSVPTSPSDRAVVHPVSCPIGCVMIRSLPARAGRLPVSSGVAQDFPR